MQAYRRDQRSGGEDGQVETLEEEGDDNITDAEAGDSLDQVDTAERGPDDKGQLKEKNGA